MHLRFATIVIGILAMANGVLLAEERKAVGPTVIVGPGIVAAGLANGEMLLGELGCVHCHETDAATLDRIYAKSPPLLGVVGSRVTPQYLRAFLSNPHGEKSGTSMPDVLHGLDEDTKARTVGDLVHFLSSLRHGRELSGVEASAYHLELGARLFHTVGCVACHDPQDDPPSAPGKADATADAVRKLTLEQAGRKDGASVPLPKLSYKTTVEELAHFLLDPLKVRPSGRMPSLSLRPVEAKAIAMYLLRDQLGSENAPKPQLIEGLKYSYHEGSFKGVEAVLKSEPKMRGSVPTFTHAVRKRDQHFGLVFEGILRAPKRGKYRFHATSDDGSIVWIGGRAVVNNDGDHSAQTRSGDIELGEGTHPIRVAYYNNGGPHAFKIEWEGPRFGRRTIESSYLAHFGQAMKPLGDEDFEIDAERAARGKSLFGSLGCASCHKMGGGSTDIASTTKAKPIPWIKVERGCLADSPPASAPRFALSATQRASLRNAIKDLREGSVATAKLKPEHRLLRSMAIHNCYACHDRGKIGGPGPKRSDYFLPTIEADLGDEARLPPSLDRVGRKLRTSWIRKVLTGGGTTRPYIATRMPQYGEANVGSLAVDFESVDLGSDAKEGRKPRYDLASHGRTLVGNKGMSCITCHSFGQYQSLGIPAADLTKMTQRVRRDWFRSFLLDPESEKPGTRMPQFWPGGLSVRENVLNGKTDDQIDAIWAYLSKGTKTKIPYGLKKVGQELIPEDEPLIYRHFIQGGGARAIGVGYPEEVHLAWDANEKRPALMWRGSFIDASKHRNGRGSGWQGPLGDDAIKLVSGAPFAVLDAKDSPWPKTSGKAAGFQMGGYRLDKERRPSFFYSFGDVEVSDFPAPVSKEGEAYFIRTLRLRSESAPTGLWFRAAASSNIEKSADGSFLVDGTLRIRFELADGAEALLRSSQGKKELLAPVVFRGGEATIVEVLGW
jgi:cytochrome c2